MSPPPLDIKSVRVAKEFKHEAQLFRARFSPCGKYFAAVGVDRLVHVWNIETGDRKSFNGHKSWISSMTFGDSNNSLYTADYQGVIHCWNYLAEANTRPRWSIPSAARDNIRALVIAGNGRFLLSAGDDAVIKVWDTKSGKPVAQLPGHRECVFSLAVHPDGGHLVSGDLLGSIRKWAIGKWTPVGELDAGALHTRKDNFIADVGGVRSLAFSQDGKQLAAGGFRDAKSNAFCPGTPAVLVFDWGSGKQKHELRLKAKSDGPINGLCFLEDGSLAGYGEHLHSATEMTFWTPPTNSPAHALAGHSAYDLDLHPDGRRLLAPVYVSGGTSGNGAQKRHREKYSPNATVLRIYNLFPDPVEKQTEG